MFRRQRRMSATVAWQQSQKLFCDYLSGEETANFKIWSLFYVLDAITPVYVEIKGLLEVCVDVV